MKIKTWDDIINENKQEIYLIGYGSLMNTKTIHDNTTIIDKVIVKGFKRVYNLPYEEDKYERATAQALKTLSKEEILSIKNPICGEGNDGALNCKYTGNINDLLNGLLISISSKDFNSMKEREYLYDLYETNFFGINPINGDLNGNNGKGYILIAKDGPWIKNNKPYEAYHRVCQIGAYNFGEYFGKLFDESTYTGDGKILIKNLKNEKNM